METEELRALTPPDRSESHYHTGLTMRVVAIILALAAGASGCPCTTNETPEQCANTCEGCVWVDSCAPIRRRNLRFGAAETGCCTYSCDRRLTAEETTALTAEEQEHRRLLCP